MRSRFLIEGEPGDDKEVGPLDRVDHIALGKATVATLIELHPNICNSHDRVLPTPEQLAEMGREADFLGESRDFDPSAPEDPFASSVRERLTQSLQIESLPHGLLALP